MVVARSGWSAQGGFEIYVDDAHVGGDLYDAFMQAGASHDIGPGCPNLIERIEAGLISYGNDVTRADSALEAGMARYCSLDAPINAIGIEALRRQAAGGVKRMICGFTVEGDRALSLRDPWPITHGDAIVRQATSVAWSPRLGTNVALGMLAADHTAIGSTVTISAPDVPRRATVVEVPFAGASQL